MKTIDSIIQASVNNGYEIVKNERRVLDTYKGKVVVYDVKLIKNNYVFSCFSDGVTLLRRMKIDGIYKG